MWDYIVKSNAFNFLIMILFFVWIDSKVHFAALLNNFKNKVIENIEKSKAEKSTAHSELKSAKKAVENLDNEIKAQIETAHGHAQTLSEKILDETREKVEQITAGIQKAVESEEKTISGKIIAKAVQECVGLAQNNIITLLEQNPQLHEKYINESIDSLEVL
ncbi:MAG: hypothetical protein LBJ74_02920 [Heliobacteriaceae bacterium]|jgi:F0F1-type ATP synthase membrane subunit b/b'|nr:hypothetical protein [Heliobacteriaceae bacterium]